MHSPSSLDIFFDSTAKTLVIYREFSRISPTLFSHLIGIIMILLHTFSMGSLETLDWDTGMTFDLLRMRSFCFTRVYTND